jgi:hypothetical protein
MNDREKASQFAAASAWRERIGSRSSIRSEVAESSQERVRRLFAMLPRHTPTLRDLPPEWTRILPSDAPLTAVERWERWLVQSSRHDALRLPEQLA